MKKGYTPISCHFYDELELLALRKKPCKIIFYHQNGQKQQIEDIILDFQIDNKAEYIILKGGLKIRLDYLKSVDGKELSGYC